MLASCYLKTLQHTDWQNRSLCVYVKHINKSVKELLLIIIFFYYSSSRTSVGIEYNRWHVINGYRSRFHRLWPIDTILCAADALQFYLLVQAHIQGVQKRFVIQFYGLFLHIPFPNFNNVGTVDRIQWWRLVVSESFTINNTDF